MEATDDTFVDNENNIHTANKSGNSLSTHVHSELVIHGELDNNNNINSVANNITASQPNSNNSIASTTEQMKRMGLPTVFFSKKQKSSHNKKKARKQSISSNTNNNRDHWHNQSIVFHENNNNTDDNDYQQQDDTNDIQQEVDQEIELKTHDYNENNNSNTISIETQAITTKVANTKNKTSFSAFELQQYYEEYSGRFQSQAAEIDNDHDSDMPTLNNDNKNINSMKNKSEPKDSNETNELEENEFGIPILSQKVNNKRIVFHSEDEPNKSNSNQSSFKVSTQLSDSDDNHTNSNNPSSNNLLSPHETEALIVHVDKKHAAQVKKRQKKRLSKQLKQMNVTVHQQNQESEDEQINNNNITKDIAEQVQTIVDESKITIQPNANTDNDNDSASEPEEIYNAQFHNETIIQPSQTIDESQPEPAQIVITDQTDLNNSQTQTASKKKKKRKAKAASNNTSNTQVAVATNTTTIPNSEIDVNTHAKYWSQRYRLFSLFDNRIKLDSTGWFSVTPESIAKHQAERCRCDVIIDAFAGCGGNAIQFAFTCNHVIAIEINPVRLACARHNARVYGVENRIDFILGDYTRLMAGLKADVVFLAPPWGGINYENNNRTYDIHNDIQPISGIELYRRTRNITKHIAYSLPRNCDPQQIASLAKMQPLPFDQPFQPDDQNNASNNNNDSNADNASDEVNGNDQDSSFRYYYDGLCELERNCVNGKVKMITAYFGELIQAE